MARNKNNDTTVIETTAVVEPVKELSERQKFRARVVTVLATENPKKKNSASHARFEDYFNLPRQNMTVDEVIRETRIRMDDIKHDFAHKFISLSE